MRIYQGKRAKDGCVVTVDGKPLPPRSDLSGNATSAFDWGYVGNGQLSLALLGDFLGDEEGGKAKLLYQDFEQRVVAVLPHDHWTLTDRDIADAVRRAEADSSDGTLPEGRPMPRPETPGGNLGFGDMPIQGGEHGAA